MKRFALTVICLLALAAPASAQLVGDISVYADDQGNSCNLNAPGGGGIVNVYVVHKFSDGGSANGARFKGTFPSGLVFLAFTPVFTPVGSFTTDLSLAYGVCVSTTTNLGNALMSNPTASPACSYFRIEAADNFANPIATDCSFGEYTVKVGEAIVNPDGTCQCNIATEAATWGKVKSLYR